MTEQKYSKLTKNKYNDLRIGDLVSFLMVCKHGRIYKAADKMYITPQGLGKQIRTLEKTIGVKLFTRTGKSRRLTKPGELLRTYAQNVVDLTLDTQVLMEKTQAENSGYVQFAFSRILSGTEIMSHIEEFDALYPGIEIDMITTTDRDAHHLVKEDGYLALTVAPASPLPQVNTAALKKYSYRLLVPEGHFLALLENPTIEDLKDVPLILLDEGHMAHQNTVQLCGQAGFTPCIRYVASGAGTAATLVKKGKGCAVLMSYLLEVLDLSGIKSIPLGDLHTWDVVFMSPESYDPSPAEVLFFNFMRKKCSQLTPDHS